VFLALAHLGQSPFVVGLVLAPVECLLYCALLPGICLSGVFVSILPFPPSSPRGGSPFKSGAPPGMHS